MMYNKSAKGIWEFLFAVKGPSFALIPDSLSKNRQSAGDGLLIRGKMQTYTCANCGKIFQAYASNRRKGHEHCCNRKCKGEYQTKLAIQRSPIKTESYCIQCREIKPISEFYKDKESRANGGVQYTCKDCVKKIRTVYYDGKVEEVNKRVRAYQHLHPGRNGVNNATEEEKKAQSILNNAIKLGKVHKPADCSACGKVGHLHGHHWHGYDKPLDVIWLCPSCHHAAHGRGPKVRANQLGALPPGSPPATRHG